MLRSQLASGKWTHCDFGSRIADTRSVSHFVFVRHGHTAHLGEVLSGRTETPLSPEGEAQVKILASALNGIRCDALLSSPRRRTLMTAHIVGAALEQAPAVSPELDEIDFGDWTLRRFDELASDPQWHSFNADRAAGTVPQGESTADVAQRVERLLQCLHASQPDGVFVLVTHADVIRIAICHCTGLDYRALLQIPIDPASVTTLARNGGGDSVVSLNCGCSPPLPAITIDARRHANTAR